ncbi:MAG: EAL domain-containing protein [Thiomicrorhabdus sp.]|jgi:diguanylate cyclase (GGDEF)-like protein|nr:EAL domain-containing protein [Thiomicrorhabdus sp.]
MLSTQRFFLGLLAIIMLSLYATFITYYLSEQQTKADLITEEIHLTLSETGYLISTSFDSLSGIQSFKSLLNRKVAQSNLISSMILAQGTTILLSTDPSIKTLPSRLDSITTFSNISAQKLLQSPTFEITIETFSQNKVMPLTLLLKVNDYAFANYFSKTRIQYISTLVIPTLLVTLSLWAILHFLLMKPLVELKKYAYYSKRPPSKFKIKELEAIRSSLVQTFDRLEKEQKALYTSARTDELSGLPNRNHLNERLNWLIEESSRSKSEFAYLFIDLDNFKNINDTLGHDIGDELLMMIAGIMQEVIRDYDIIARVGGDEFVVVLSQYQNHIELNHIIQRIIAKLSEIHTVGTYPVRTSASIGVAFYPKDGIDSRTLLKNSDIAMYEAKKSGKNQIHYFTESLHQTILAEVELENDLRSALQNQEFELYYQPKVDIASGKIIGAESLVRWHHPTKGMISPLQFIPIAEQTGLMIELGEWILHQALQQQKQWQELYQTDLLLSINISAVQFGYVQFFSNFQSLCNQFDLDLKLIDIEVTESVLMQNTESNLGILKKIRALGVSISLDDFGTGYSSLAYLKNLPINTLKIDKAFLDDYATQSGRVFIDTIVQLAHNLHINVVAEGVESESQLAYLKEIGCDIYQGYHCSRPLPAKDFMELVQKHQP